MGRKESALGLQSWSSQASRRETAGNRDTKEDLERGLTLRREVAGGA